MKNLVILFCLLLCFNACKESTESSQHSISQTQKILPAEISKVMDAHGGINLWRSMRAMRYDIVKEGGNEKQYIDLQDRREYIEGPDFKMGFDGKDHWIEADTSLKMNPVFYKNLMFYFYAMPFVLADDGIQYSKTENLEIENISYPGLRISYDQDIGISPKDEYFIHYDPETFRMEWLGYTVTYFSKEKSTKIKWIRYDDWMQVNGLVLPKSLAWYNLENDLPTTEKSRRVFDQVELSAKSFDSKMFAVRNGARIVKE